MSPISIISLFSFSIVLSKVSCSYYGGRYQASTRKDLLNLGFTSMHNITRLSICKSVRCSKSIVSLTYMATPPPCLFLLHRSNEKSLRATLELSILLSSFVSLIAIISILFSTTKTSISSLCFTKDGEFSEQISKPFVQLIFLFYLNFCRSVYFLRDVQTHFAVCLWDEYFHLNTI